ncbi:MAG TPA: methyl-accepting chemotaxis protein [Coleofasciculaceae cyanobacterium]
MASNTDFAQEYGQAQMAYMQGNYQQAAAICDRLVEDFPDNASVRLLLGHIYCYGLQQYGEAREQYEKVLNLTAEPDFIEYANEGLEYANQADSGVVADSPEDFDNPSFNDSGSLSTPGASAEFNRALEGADFGYDDFSETDGLGEIPTYESWSDSAAQEDESSGYDLGSLDFDETGSDDFSPPSAEPFENPFGSSEINYEYDLTQQSSDVSDTPFAFTGDLGDDHDDFQSWGADSIDFGLDSDVFGGAGVEDTSEEFFSDIPGEDEAGMTFVIPSSEGFEESAFDQESGEPFAPSSQFDTDFSDREEEVPAFNDEQIDEPYHSSYPVFEDETLLMSSGELEDPLDRDEFEYLSGQAMNPAETLREHDSIEDDQTLNSTYDQNGFNSQDHFDFDTFDEAFANQTFVMDDVTEAEEETLSGIETRSRAREGFLDEFDVFDDDLGSIPDFSLGVQEDLSSEGADEADFDVLSNSGAVLGATAGLLSENGDIETAHPRYRSTGGEDEMFSISNSSEQIPIFNQTKDTDNEPIVNVEQGPLAFFENAPLKRKQWMTAFAAGLASAVVVAIISYFAQSMAPKNQSEDVVPHLQKTGMLATAGAFLASFGTTWALGQVTTRQIKRATSDLQSQFEAVSQGNLNASATVYSEDEFGQLATSFNQMARVILTTTSEAQRKAEEQEQAKEDLQRQVIRLLDDVEGAARGDLTVQAEVTADVLGAVADSFNLTIQNLREIVQQVKQAARQVNKGSSDSETFARSLSSDALRQAEELAVTLNSVQVMTDSIQRVAESAREAEDVARSASETAVKGGEAVERTVAGILQIRETVAETTRKVKRLAESSQQISTIVALISTIASRTNLLALNASIEAARAGEAGRGFAIVADEVRQLADRAAKALKEIEQIVLQIQSETGSVMTAMEEGTQQVIEGTRRAEQAKRSLEDIVQVSNRIDALVRSIAADTVEQTETSRAVAQVMQSVELTAQETSQEAQRVSGALGNLVGVARDLLTSVERFRVESNDAK